jgi:hypothetical protein
MTGGTAVVRDHFYGGGISKVRQIFRANRSGISEWRGTGSRRPVRGFQ